MAETTLLDANVLLDMFTRDPRWGSWAEDALAEAIEAGPVVVNQVVYAEISVRFTDVAELEEALPAAHFVRENLPWEAAFLAAKAHAAYRRRGGTRATTLPDFFIGAHAAVRAYRLLTRDATRYRTAFPRLTILAP
ncbi:MAG: type II toxin-antitoxin system VapC family toxin [Austwickia sp.]|nr:type II toxin-antitoxin system VapC family toxin [Actinomycetota bacterium]MCB1251703.1 type II toxin-antitoxin system VapC family toxin [Austwickia sp.]MCO5308365.1 type II toxin-antitoxin system VapC family toxin [Austwickia sp.]